jgi:hypothetical protein
MSELRGLPKPWHDAKIKKMEVEKPAKEIRCVEKAVKDLVKLMSK